MRRAEKVARIGTCMHSSTGCPQAPVFWNRLRGRRDCEAMSERGSDIDPTEGVSGDGAKGGRASRDSGSVMRFDELDADEAYDGVWAEREPAPCPEIVLPTVLTRVRKALRPGGLHYASYKSGGAEGRDRFGRYFD